MDTPRVSRRAEKRSASRQPRRVVVRRAEKRSAFRQPREGSTIPNYRRNQVPGGTYFFTVNLLDRTSDLLVTNVEDLRRAVRKVRLARPFHINAWVVLPDHLHAIWTLPPGDSDYPGRWRKIKKAFVKSLPATEPRSATRMANGERGVWQRRFWEHTIRNDQDYAAHMDYVHFNPVRHGLVNRPIDWPFSSFAACVRRGVYPESWADEGAGIDQAGEQPEEP